jgi:uncharacterized membrane protein YdjX (TVP38/TMEM64 family)
MQRVTTDRRRFPRTRDVLFRVIPLVATLVIVAFIAYKLGWYEYRDALDHIQRLRKAHSVVGFTVAFVIAFGIGTSLGVPGFPLIVTAGALFGTLIGTVISWCGAMIGAAIGYWIARTIGHDVVARWVKRFRRVDAAVDAARHFSGMLRLRLIPVLPLGTVNFVCGLARANFVVYLAATAVGVIPAIVIYTYFADSLLERVGNGRADALEGLIFSSALLLLLSLARRWFVRSRSDQASVT